MRNLMITAIALSLAACGGTGNRVASAGTAATPEPRQAAVRVPPTRPVAPPTASAGTFRAPQVMSLPGIDGVIGAGAADLQRQFGTARLDVYEGDARKLQFSGQACVLDIYLYPMSRGAEPTATYVEARRASDALDVDRAACIRALRGR